MAVPSEHTGTSPYQIASTPELGTWDPNQRDSAPDNNHFFVVKNLRQEHAGEYSTRSGYKATLIDAPSNTTVYDVVEYDVHDTGFNVTLYYHPADQKVYAVFYNKKDEVVTTTVAVVSSLAAAPKMVAAMQYQTNLVVTVYGTGVFAIFPDDDTLVAWSVIELGKELAITPNFRTLRFADNTSGDLIAFYATNDNNTAKYEYIPGKQDPSELRLPIGAKYWLVGGTKFSKFDLTNFKRHEWNPNDPQGSQLQTDSIDHLATNGWGYRAIFVHEDTDTNGNKYTWRSAPSVDWWCPNMMYAPAYNKFNGTGVIVTHENGALVDNIAGTSGVIGAWRDPRGIGEPPGDQTITLISGQPWAETTDERTIEAVPSAEDLYDLQKAYRRYFNSFTGFAEAAGAIDPYTFTAIMLGWLQPSGDPNFVTDLHFKMYPYKVPVSAYELKRAPMMNLRWSDFANIPTSETDETPIPNPDFQPGGRFADVVKIEIYRTAYNKATTKDIENNPLFGHYLYGFVTTLEKNGEFTDDIKDEALDFGKRPERYDGYLKGQLTGKVIREYNAKVVLGNIESNYEVFTPSIVQQAFAVETAVGFLRPTSELATIEADGYPTRAFFYQYLDSQGNYSDIRYVHVDTTDTGANYNVVAFRTPHGYAPSIVTVRIFRGIFSGGSRDYVRIADVPAKQGWFALPTQIAPVTGSSGLPIAANNRQTVEAGAVAYSEPNDIFFYKFTNVEIIHKFAPVTFMEALLGPLWVWTDRSVDLTQLTADKPRGEEETKHIGCIGFHAAAKTNRVVFFLSAFGLYYADAGGVMAFPAYVQNIILDYIKEKIEGVEDLANARRASIGWLARREELWLHLPSSEDLGGSLPARTLIFRFFGGEAGAVINYEFELTNRLDLAYPEITRPVIFASHTDGSLFSSHLQIYSPGDPKIMQLDNDRTEWTNRWQGATYLEKRYPLGLAGIKKKMRAVNWRASALVKMNVITGYPYPNAALTSPILDYQGGIVQSARMFPVVILGTSDSPQTFKHRISGRTAETTAYNPAVRFITEPDDSGNNSVTYYGIDLYYVLDGVHP